jgi:predicted DNA-binding transcriptional regulator AlpA
MKATEQCSDRLIAAKALGQMLSLSKRQVYRLNSCGKIPAPIRIGGAVRWSNQEIADWLAAGAPDRKTWEARKAVKGVNHAG